MGILSKGIRAVQKARVQRALKPKASKKKAVKKDTARVQSEARAGAKRADRSKKIKQVESRVLPSVSRVRSQLKGMSANEIASVYDGREITAMKRKLKDPKIIARLDKALEKRKKIGRKFIAERQGQKVDNKDWGLLGPNRPDTADMVPVPRKGSRGAKLKGKYGSPGEDYKRGGTVKRKSGGKMNTDGNSFVASLYKCGKVGG